MPVPERRASRAHSRICPPVRHARTLTSRQGSPRDRSPSSAAGPSQAVDARSSRRPPTSCFGTHPRLATTGGVHDAQLPREPPSGARSRGGGVLRSLPTGTRRLDRAHDQPRRDLRLRNHGRVRRRHLLDPRVRTLGIGGYRIDRHVVRTVVLPPPSTSSRPAGAPGHGSGRRASTERQELCAVVTRWRRRRIPGSRRWACGTFSVSSGSRTSRASTARPAWLNRSTTWSGD